MFLTQNLYRVREDDALKVDILVPGLFSYRSSIFLSDYDLSILCIIIVPILSEIKPKSKRTYSQIIISLCLTYGRRVPGTGCNLREKKNWQLRPKVASAVTCTAQLCTSSFCSFTLLACIVKFCTLCRSKKWRRVCKARIGAVLRISA